MRSLAASEFRRLHRKVAQAERRLAMVLLPGKVVPGSQQGRTLRLELGRSADGRPILSPRVRFQQPGAGKLKSHFVPADHEQLYLISGSGTVGAGSLAALSTYDADTPPPSEDPQEAVTEYGKARTEMRDDRHRDRLDDVRVTIRPDYVKLRWEDKTKPEKPPVFLVVQDGGIVSSHPIVIGADPEPQL